MRRSKSFNMIIFGTVSLVALTAGAIAEVTDTADNAGIEKVIVTGTRETTQTQYTSTSPIDVLDAGSLQSTISSRLNDTLATLIPSFDVKSLPASDGSQFIRPASINNLSPDMTLVLVNGKRFHRSAFLGTNGSQATDLDQIPSYASGHIEVLRDGASAQYGSDAIAGVINIILDDKPGFSTYAQVSQYYYGDGLQLQWGGRAGFELPKDGRLVVTLEYDKSNETSRTNQRADAIAYEKSSGITVADPVQRWGNPDMQTIKGALNQRCAKFVAAAG